MGGVYLPLFGAAQWFVRRGALDTFVTSLWDQCNKHNASQTWITNSEFVVFLSIKFLKTDKYRIDELHCLQSMFAMESIKQFKLDFQGICLIETWQSFLDYIRTIKYFVNNSSDNMLNVIGINK